MPNINNSFNRNSQFSGSEITSKEATKAKTKITKNLNNGEVVWLRDTRKYFDGGGTNTVVKKAYFIGHSHQTDNYGAGDSKHKANLQNVPFGDPSNPFIRNEEIDRQNKNSNPPRKIIESGANYNEQNLDSIVKAAVNQIVANFTKSHHSYKLKLYGCETGERIINANLSPAEYVQQEIYINLIKLKMENLDLKGIKENMKMKIYAEFSNVVAKFHQLQALPAAAEEEGVNEHTNDKLLIDGFNKYVLVDPHLQLLNKIDDEQNNYEERVNALKTLFSNIQESHPGHDDGESFAQFKVKFQELNTLSAVISECEKALAGMQTIYKTLKKGEELDLIKLNLKIDDLVLIFNELNYGQELELKISAPRGVLLMDELDIKSGKPNNKFVVSDAYVANRKNYDDLLAECTTLLQIFHTNKEYEDKMNKFTAEAEKDANIHGPVAARRTLIANIYNECYAAYERMFFSASEPDVRVINKWDTLFKREQPLSKNKFLMLVSPIYCKEFGFQKLNSSLNLSV